jgi:aquaporin TIP
MPTREERAVVDRELIKALIIEFIGPFALVFMGVGAIILTQGQDVVAIAFAHGLGLGLVLLAAGHISGGHFNPAVTIAMLATRRIDTQRAVAYIVAQLAGGLAAAGVLVLCYRDLERNAVNLGVPAVGANNSVGNAVLMEGVLTFFLVLVIFGTAVDTRTPKVISGLAIGLAITMDILAGSAVSGAAMNPARWFGPAIVQWDWSNFWVWWVGPIVGGLVAAFLYNDVILNTIGGENPARTRVVEENEGHQVPPVRNTTAQVDRSRRARRRGR